MSIPTFTSEHVVLSLVRIFSGTIALIDMFSAIRRNGWTALFLVTTVLTSVTGFFFPRDQLLPSHVVSVLSLVVLAVTIPAFYVYCLARFWYWIYVASAVLVLYFKVFVEVIQSSETLPFPEPLAPTQSQPPFLVAQAVVRVIFIVCGNLAVRSFLPETKFPASISV